MAKRQNQDLVSFRVTVQPRRMGFARKLIIGDVYDALWQLKQSYPDLRVLSTIVHTEGVRDGVRDEQELARMATSEQDRERPVFYANPVAPEVFGDSRIDFETPDKQMSGALRIRDRYPGARGVVQIVVAILGTILDALMVGYGTIGGSLFGIVFLLMVYLFIDGIRRHRNNRESRIQFDMTVVRDKYWDLRRILDRIKV